MTGSISSFYAEQLPFVTRVGEVWIYSDLPDPAPSLIDGVVILADGTIITTGDDMSITVGPQAKHGQTYTAIRFGDIGEVSSSHPLGDVSPDTNQGYAIVSLTIEDNEPTPSTPTNRSKRRRTHSSRPTAQPAV
jgi:hypothetical protein